MKICDTLSRYSSINPYIHLCNVSAGAEQHVAMRLGDGFGIWSMRISDDGSRVVAGTNHAGLVLCVAAGEKQW